ncbi:uncharacterized protein LOC126798773 isoform X2 [Argentina anserina]|uniref:uncharacterized protein LOC126798773 isoform X2 n=1 Tax=Argentina anserina TaxID=57926 RepID=UPI0021763705|nr:uncharacterized protein LOC126798773 isoform X2 [Potentilla anserina]
MEVEKKRSKGGFFNLFDWNGKSKKKLFSSNSESSGSQQGQENVENFSQTQLIKTEVDEKGASSSHKESSEWNCTSSVTSDEGGGSRAPGVVARLMGLDSLPTTTVTDSSSTLSVESLSHRVPHHDRGNPNLWGDFYAMDYMNMPNKLDRDSWNPVESRTQKLQNRPIERFQTEILPPKSAKSIPVTHHKLLSPIKTPGFIPTKNAAYIMEAAAKMIEASPRASSKSKISSMRSSSIPLRIRDLKEKMEAVPKASRPARPKEPSDAKYVKGGSGYKSYNGSDNVPSPKGFVVSEKQNYNDIRSKGNAASLVVQAKVNARRKEGSPPFSNRSSTNQKEQNEVNQNEFSKTRQSTQRPAHKRTAVSNKSVLKQNNQKQNCVSNKDKMTSKNVVSKQPIRRVQPSNGFSRPNRTINKVLVNSETGSRKMGSMESVTGKEISFSTIKDVSGKIRSASQEFHLEENVADNGLVTKGERSVKCNVAMEGYTNLFTDSRKHDMDVISFTFTSPLKKSISELQSAGQVGSMNKRFCIDSFGNSDQHSYQEPFTFSSPGLNVIGGDALSVLLEQKLQELTYKVESSQRNLYGEGTSASSSSSLQDFFSSEASTASRGKKYEFGLLRDSAGGRVDFDSLSADVNQKWQGPEGMRECSSSSKSCVTGKYFDYQFDPVSVCEPSFESESCTDNRSSGNGSESDKCLVAQAQDQIYSFSSSEMQPSYSATDLSDSASTWEVSGKNITRIFGFHSPNQSTDWELEYVQYILSKVNLGIEDFALGDSDYVISPSLFDNLLYQEEYPKLQQKLLFDSVNESLHNRCKQIVVGSQKALDQWETLSQRKESLAAELYKEITVWNNMGDLRADDLVDKDMSTGLGRWLNFEVDAFEEGVEIEKEILSCLVDELVSDFMLY